MTAVLALVQPASDSNELAVCPSCHTEAEHTRALDLAAGAWWRCPCCDSFWDGERLATVARYNAWLVLRNEATVSPAVRAS